MNRKYLGWLVMLLAMSAGAQAQRTVLAMPDDQGVWVRWTQPDVAGTKQVRVYRQDGGAGEWKLLTPEPLAYGKYDISSQTATNPQLKRIKDIADDLRKNNKMSGMGLGLVLTNAVESREFSRYLGILYLDQTAERGKTYAYEVREVSGGSEQSYGVSTVVTAGKLVPAAAPAEIKTLEGDSRLFFSWKPEEARLTGAHVYYKIGGGNWLRFNKKIILPSKVPGKNGEKAYPEWLFLADSLTNGTTYTCMVKGVDLFGFETEPSAEFKLTPRDKTPPPAVTNVGIKAVLDRVYLTWELPNAKGVDGIRVYRSSNDTLFVSLNEKPLPPNTRRYEDVVEEMGRAYVYRIATVDKAGNENSTDGRFVDVRDVKPPVQVRNVKAVPDTGVVKLTWFPNPEKDLKGYIVYRMAKTAQGGDTMQVTTKAVTTTAYNDTLPKVAKNTFVYFVSAMDTSYNIGPKSGPAAAVLPDPLPPGTPTIKGIRKDGEALRIVWLPGMDPDLEGYIIYRSTEETGPDSSWKPLTARPLAAGDTAYSDRALEPGVSYFYALKALDNSGNQSPRSDAFMGSVTTVRLKTIAQDIVVKHAKGKPEATISWTLPKNEGVIGCMVYRKEAKEEYMPVSGLVQDYKVTDQGLKPGHTYYYEIRAFDKVGNYSKSAPVTLTIEAE